MTAGPTEALLAEGLGIPLLAYLCASTPADIERRLDGDDCLTHAGERVLVDHLVPLAQRAALEQAEHPGFPIVSALEPLTQVLPNLGMPLGSALRSAAGGDVPAPLVGSSSDADEVKSVLFQMAIDSYPVFLVPRTDRWFGPRVSLFHHPSRHRLEEALGADDSLSRLYPDEDPGLGRSGSVFSSLGRGGGVQSVMFGETVIGSAWHAASMVAPIPAPTALLDAIDDSVDRIRAAVMGEPCEVRTLIFITGLTTEDGITIATPWGDLRALTDAERLAAPPSLEGAVSGTDANGRSVTVNYAGELVLDTTVEYKLVVSGRDGDMNFPPWPRVDDRHSLRRRIEGIQLAALLAVDRPPGSWPTARFAWQWVADPFSQGRQLGWVDPRTPSFMPYEITPDECTALSSWAVLIDERWSRRIDIAVRRVLSATHARTDAADRLVDAVIAWENLFGTSEGEPRLRITAAIAWLLGEDAEERASLQMKLKRLYDDRSKVVHGALVDDGALGERSNDALVVAIQCLRRLFGDRHDVLTLPDGSSRSLRMILGG